MVEARGHERQTQSALTVRDFNAAIEVWRRAGGREEKVVEEQDEVLARFS